jgi:hypothetical protein
MNTIPQKQVFQTPSEILIHRGGGHRDYKLEVTIARKVLPHPKWIKASMCNLLNKGLFI